MSDFFGELMESIDSLTEEQVNALLSKLEVKRAGSQKIQEESKDEQEPMACPHCGSIAIKKHGRKSGRQRYYCKDCHKTFVETSNCIQYRSRLTPARWRGLLLGMVQNLSLSQIADIIGVSIATVWQNRQKVCMALQEAFGLQDKFIDIAECDEYYMTVSFKGKRDPAFFIYTLGRMPRHHMTYEEKVYYLKKHGFWDELQKDPVHLEALLSSGNTYKRGISNDQTCILTCKDRNGNLFITPACVGRLETADVIKSLQGRFASDAILVTDSHSAYSGFAESEHIQLEQIEADKHSKGAYNLGRINALHSSLSAYYPKSAERAPATKYLDLSLMLFWWLEKNGQLSSADKVDKLYELISDEINISGTDYKSITSRELILNTKGLFPNKV